MTKALDGQLREGDLSRYRRHGRQPGDESLKSFLSKLRFLRMRGAQLKSMPPEVISDLDAAIEILKNAMTLHRAKVTLKDAG